MSDPIESHLPTPAESDVAGSTAASNFALDLEQLSLSGAINGYIARVRGGGDLGLLPAALALAVLSAVFGIFGDNFFTLFNFGNFWTQAAPICVLAMGVTFVLLLGEIDLAAGYTAGVCAAVMASRLKGDTPLILALVLAFAASIVIGLLTGWLVAKLHIPSFIVTLSFFLSWQGVVLLLTKEGGTIRVEDDFIIAIENKNMAPWLGWVLWAIVVGGLGASMLIKSQSRRRSGLVSESTAVVGAKIAAVAVGWGLATYLLNLSRGANNLKGVPWAIVLVLVLTVVLSLMLGRTAWGRHLYAVGGNAEAARRAGIDVARIRMSAFVVCSVLACFAGITLASRINSVDPQTGGNDTLLIAVGAAVIGGTSLFGGRGRVVNAVLGGLVFAVINNGLPLLGEQGPINFSDAGPKFIVNGVVLLGFASIDALSRKRSAAA
jgi:D-xylose transport system permease protein